MSKETGTSAYWPYSWRPAGRTLVEKLVALAPDRANEFWRRWKEGFPKDEVERLIAELKEARKPKMHTANEIAERALRQSAEQLAAKHEEEWQHAKKERRQAIVRFWVDARPRFPSSFPLRSIKAPAHWRVAAQCCSRRLLRLATSRRAHWRSKRLRCARH